MTKVKQVSDQEKINYDLESWTKVEQAAESKYLSKEEREFCLLVKRMDEKTRLFLSVMCQFEHTQRTDGEWGNSAVDHLWQTFQAIKAGKDLIAMSASMSHSSNYLHGMRYAIVDAMSQNTTCDAN